MNSNNNDSSNNNKKKKKNDDGGGGAQYSKELNEFFRLFGVVDDDDINDAIEGKSESKETNDVIKEEMIRKDEQPSSSSSQQHQRHNEDVINDVLDILKSKKGKRRDQRTTSDGSNAAIVSPASTITQESPSTVNSDLLEEMNPPLSSDEIEKRFRVLQDQIRNFAGSGEVKFFRLDDVDPEGASNEKFLSYNPSTRKIFFSDPKTPLVGDEYTIELFGGDDGNVVSVLNLPDDRPIGPIESLSFDTNLPDHSPAESYDDGTIHWNHEDQTLNIHHPNGVIQQVGQEFYGYVRNNTGSTITKGTAVRFAGAEQNGSARLEITPMIADGSVPILYTFGIAAQDIDDGEDGRAIVWGKIRDIDATGAGFSDPADDESWSVGDVLYVSPKEAGMLTNTKPTAPNIVVPIAAVLNNDSNEGELFIRPTIEQQMYYGRFSRKSDLTITQQNQAFAIPFDTTDISNGVTLSDDGTQIETEYSGFFQIVISAQVTATSQKGRAFFWIKKNGTNVEDTCHITTISNGDTFNITFDTSISMDANDYIEVYWARTVSGIKLDVIPESAFAPATTAATISVTQVQL